MTSTSSSFGCTRHMHRHNAVAGDSTSLAYLPQASDIFQLDVCMNQQNRDDWHGEIHVGFYRSELQARQPLPHLLSKRVGWNCNGSTNNESQGRLAREWSHAISAHNQVGHWETQLLVCPGLQQRTAVMSTKGKGNPTGGHYRSHSILQRTAHVDCRPSKAAKPSSLHLLTLSHMLQKQPTCMPGRSMKFRSVLSSPRHSTGTRLAFCCMASLTKPARSTRSLQAAVMLPKQMWRLCRQIMCWLTSHSHHRRSCSHLKYAASLLHLGGSTFMVGVDDKLLLAAEAASVHKLSLPAWHQYDRSALI